MNHPNRKTPRSIWSIRVDRLAWARDRRTFRWIFGSCIAMVLVSEWVMSGTVFTVDALLSVVPWVLLLLLIRWLARL